MGMHRVYMVGYTRVGEKRGGIPGLVRRERIPGLIPEERGITRRVLRAFL